MLFHFLLINLLAEIVGKMANTTMINVKNVIDRHLATLLGILDTNDFLLTELVGEGVMDEPTKEEILACSTVSETNKRLLKWLEEHPENFDVFLTKLRQHRQGHVANLLDGTKGELPLKPEVKQNLQKMMRTLTIKLNPDTGLVDNLKTSDDISEEVYEGINAELKKQQRNKILLESLIRGSDKTYGRFLQELVKTDQSDVLNIIDSSELRAESTSHLNILKKHLSILSRCTDINVLTIAQLRASRVIDNAMESKLKAPNIDSVQRVLLVYSWLQTENKDTFDEYIKVMITNEQRHVSNLLTSNLNGQQPMSQAKYERLKKVRPDLIRGIQCLDIVLPSAVRNCQASEDTDFAISFIDYENITQGSKIDSIRNDNLIDAILRRTDYSFNSLQKALRETHQEHMANLMDEGEVIGIHVNTTRPDKDEELAREMNHAIHKPSSSEYDFIRQELEELNKKNIPIVAAEAGNSIVIYTYCRTQDDMKRYVELLNCHELQVIYENILCNLLKIVEPDTSQTLEAALTLEEKDKQLIKDFTGLDENDTDMEELPCILKPNCGIHELPTDVYCYDCKSEICPQCAQKDHSDHKKTSDIGNRADSLRKQLQDDLQLISFERLNIDRIKEKNEQDKVEFLRKIEDSEKATIQNCEELKEKVEKFKQMLLQERTLIKERMLLAFDKKARDIDSLCIVTEDFKKYAHKLVEEGSALSICQKYPALQERAAKLKHLSSPAELKKQFDHTFVISNRSMEITKESIENHGRFLEEHMEPDFGLVDELCSTGVLSKDDSDVILKLTDRQERIREILKIVLKRSRYAEFASALAATKQVHLINYLCSNGKYQIDFGGDWPLTERECILLESMGNRLNFIFGISDDILTALCSSRVINNQQKEFISSRKTTQEKSDTVLSLLRKGSINDFNRMYSEFAAWEANLAIRKRNEAFLVDTMEPDFGLIQELVNNGAILQKDAKLIQNEKYLDKRNVKILEAIFAKNKYKELLAALSKTRQMHIVNWLQSYGVYDPKFGDDWPLSINEVNLLNTHWKQVINQLKCSNKHLEKLENEQVISENQKNLISQIKSYRDRTEALLDVLHRGSLKSYKKAVECLGSTDQSHLTRILTPVHTQVNVVFQVNQVNQVNVNKEWAELWASFNKVIATGSYIG